MGSSSSPVFIESKSSPDSEREKQEIVELLNTSLNDPLRDPYNWTPVEGKTRKFQSRFLEVVGDTSKVVLGALARGKNVRARCVWDTMSWRHLEVDVGDISELRSLLKAFEVVKIRAKKVIELRQKKGELRELKKEINALELELGMQPELKRTPSASGNFGGHANLFPSDREQDVVGGISC